MAFAQADGAQEDDVGLVAYKVQAEEVLDGQAVDFLGPVPAELLQGFDHGEAGLLDAAAGGSSKSRRSWRRVRCSAGDAAGAAWRCSSRLAM
jgi:hypothetical protein